MWHRILTTTLTHMQNLLDIPPQAREIDASLVAQALALDVAEFRTLMDREKISVLCERGTGEDEGRMRLTYYHAGRRARFLFDGAWQPVPA